MVEKILAIFREGRDPHDFMARHDLGEVLFLVLCALLCGEKTGVDIAAGHEEEFREVLDLRHGPPSHDTISRVLRLLDPHELEHALRACLAVMGQHLRRGAVLAVDGDALHCRADTAAVIREAGADYVLELKANQQTLYASAQATFAQAPDDLSHVMHSEGGHGRHEQRTASVMPAPAVARAKLPGLVAFGRIERVRQINGQPAPSRTHYYALSRRLMPEQLALLVRGHWGIENHLHWPLDVIFDEDDARSRKIFSRKTGRSYESWRATSLRPTPRIF